MKTKVITSLLILISSFCNLNLRAAEQIPLLEKIISIEVKNGTVEETLSRISTLGKFTFSYSSGLVDEATKVNLTAHKKSIRQVLDLIFKGTLVYKEKGNYIILSKGVVPEEKSSSPQSITINGYVSDISSGNIISAASIFDQSTLTAANTDAFGFFELKINKPVAPLTLSIYKKNYSDTLITVNSTAKPVVPVNISLAPLRVSGTKLQSSEGLIPLKDSLHAIVPDKLPALSERAIIMENVSDTLYRKFQVSFLPFLGTNHKLSGNVVNEYSFNVLGGYSMGTTEFELGGLFNIDRDYVENAQLAGLFNIVGGEVEGAQIAGLFNFDRKGITGAQIAGLMNINGDSLEGVAIAGLFNYTHRAVVGFSLAGLFNYQNGFASGAQLAGLFNVAPAGISGTQLAGLFNVSGKETGGAQLSGLINLSIGEVKGTQIGFLNIAKTAGGSQLGFLNISDSINGVPLGFLSYVNKGYHNFELFTDETFPYNVAFHTGVRSLYNIFASGIDPGTNDMWYYGYGLGTSPRISKKFDLNIQFTANWINRDHEPEFNLLNRFYFGVDYRIIKNISIFAAASLNGLLTLEDNIYPLDLKGDQVFYEEDFDHDLNLKVFLGFKGGLKIWW